jgi:peptidoglycan/xylan/chitin deacetylase (PgdA/CDA1 family)
MHHLSNGAIILMHTTEVEAQTLDQVITLIQQQGYQIVTLDEVLA